MKNIFPLITGDEVKNKRVIVRVDVNVPIENGEVADDYRIKKILPTLRLLNEHADRVVLIGHHSDTAQTFEPIARALNHFIKTSFVTDIFNTDAYAGDGLFLCENLRFFDGEEKNDFAFATQLASLGEVYVNEAFSASHRK